jgi:hypothetical protein
MIIVVCSMQFRFPMTDRETIILYRLLCEDIRKYFLLILLVAVGTKIKKKLKKTWHMRN